MTTRRGPWDGDAFVSLVNGKVRVWIEAVNVTAEVYITRTKAKELRDNLDWILKPTPKREA